jgi:S-formylglutathione hydrolase FrmB
MVLVGFRVPADYVLDTDIGVLLWLTDDWTGASNFLTQSYWQVYTPGQEVILSNNVLTSNNVVVSVVDTLHAIGLNPISDLVGGEFVLYAAMYQYGSGPELLLFNGLEFVYQGYV